MFLKSIFDNQLETELVHCPLRYTTLLYSEAAFYLL